ncbi:glycerophosphodiester phosphodiesterase family protein [Bermanella sp. R86510]|uniref:glycerophosphodiester phosphodiesterase family protein n=1 Tax=unclassified Bermanella TaxID=2627862 RepID=UPI0037CB925A
MSFIRPFYLFILFALLTACSQSNHYSLGPRPLYIIESMPESELKSKLQACIGQSIMQHDFSIAHRGAPLMFPEHTEASYRAAATMGAGILECDATFTADGHLVCRHDQCDLHQTTDILLRPELAKTCRQPFKAATANAPASALCCTSEISLQEFESLCAKMDGVNNQAKTVDEYIKGTESWRTELYNQCQPPISHKDSIALFKTLNVKMTPELKATRPTKSHDKHTPKRTHLAQQLVNEYKQAGIKPEQVWLQSFEWQDIEYWIANEPEFAQQVVWLDSRYTQEIFDPNNLATVSPSMQQLKQAGLNIIAPPLWVLITEQDGNIVPSAYAVAAKEAGLDIITWTLERSGPLNKGGGWYYQSINNITTHDGMAMNLLHVLDKQVGVKGVFSDWPATTTFYANCMMD